MTMLDLMFIAATLLSAAAGEPTMTNSWTLDMASGGIVHIRTWDLAVERDGDHQKLTVSSGGKLVMTGSGPAGKTCSVTFPKQKN
jgi:hypothetical protein